VIFFENANIQFYVEDNGDENVVVWPMNLAMINLILRGIVVKYSGKALVQYFPVLQKKLSDAEL
jgi:hypothetical protein